MYQSISLKDLSFCIRALLESEIGLIETSGEVCDFKFHEPSGNVYFTLSDGESSLRIVMFRGDFDLKSIEGIKNGDSIKVIGRVGINKKASQYQLVANSIERFGLGALMLRFFEIKKKLADEGLFDEVYKKKIPFLPRAIGVITSESGAVLHDILRTLESRFPCPVVLFGAVMQGVLASKSVLDGVFHLNKQNEVDVIIIARGGGSFEDLFCFNDEDLARGVFASKIPVISAIGHETDFTILDFVADVRASTPTAAVRLATPEFSVVCEMIRNLIFRLHFAVLSVVKKNSREVSFLRYKIGSCIDRFIKLKYSQVSFLEKKMFSSLKVFVNQKKIYIEKMLSFAKSVDPSLILQKGYLMLVNSKTGKAISSVNDLKGKTLRAKIVMFDGEIDVSIASLDDKLL